MSPFPWLRTGPGSASDGLPKFDLTRFDQTYSTGFSLANVGVEYLVYQPSSGAFDVSLAAGTYGYEWFNPGANATAGTGTITSPGGSQPFTPPFAGDAVLYVQRQ